jgi:hypothetical protein
MLCKILSRRELEVKILTTKRLMSFFAGRCWYSRLDPDLLVFVERKGRCHLVGVWKRSRPVDRERGSLISQELGQPSALAGRC